jgi:hypothetical protein
VADVVGGEIFSGVEIDTDEVVDGVVVLDAVEPPDCDAPGVGPGVLLGPLEDAVDGLDERLDLGGRRPRPGLGRHFAAGDHLEDFLEGLAPLEDGQVIGEGVQTEVGAFGLLAVAVDAVFLEERGTGLREVSRLRGCDGFARQPGEGEPGEDWYEQQRQQQSRHYSIQRGGPSGRESRQEGGVSHSRHGLVPELAVF